MTALDVLSEMVAVWVVEYVPAAGTMTGVAACSSTGFAEAVAALLLVSWEIIGQSFAEGLNGVPVVSTSSVPSLTDPSTPPPEISPFTTAISVKPS